MTDDLDTLLRDAGRQPTIDLDVAAVHTAGRRRATTRRVATGVGALALAGVVGLGVQSLLPDLQGPEVVDTPEGSATDGSEESTADAVEVDVAADVALAERLGLSTVRIADGRLDSEIVRAGFGADLATSTPAGGSIPFFSGIAADADGTVWFTDELGNLQYETIAPDGAPESGVFDDSFGHRVLGPDGGGNVLVAVEDRSDPDAVTLAIHRARGTVLEEEPIPGFVDVLPSIGGDPMVVDMAAGGSPESLLALHVAGETYDVEELLAGGGGQSVYGTGGDHWVLDIAVADGRLFLLEGGADGHVDLLVTEVGSSAEPSRVATPVGRTFEGDTLGLSAAAGTEEIWVAVSATADDGSSTSWVADLTTIEGAELRGTTSDSPSPALVDGVWEDTGLPGLLLLQPRDTASVDDTGELAACASDQDAAAINAPPSGFGGEVWWLCWDAMGQLAEGQAHPFVATEVFSESNRGNGTTTQLGLTQLLRLWAAGPQGDDAAAGLSGPLSPDVASFRAVVVDGASVTVDLTSGPQVGVLGTTTGRATFVQGLASTVLQHDQFTTLTVTLDGDCAAWAALAETTGCPTYDRTDTAWATQAPAGSCGPADEAYNGAPAMSTFEPSLWFSCFHDGMSIPPYPFYRVDVEPVDGALEKVAAALVEDWLAGPTPEQEARGLSGWHLDGDVALDGVYFDSAVRARVVIDDVASEPEGGRSIPTGAGDGSSYRQALAGLLLQLDGIEEVVIVTNGLCGDWEGPASGDPDVCIVWTVDDAPWVQNGFLEG